MFCLRVLLHAEELCVLNLSLPEVRTPEALAGYNSRIPDVPHLPPAFSEALSSFHRDPSTQPAEADVATFWRWLRRVSETLEMLQTKLSVLCWHSYLREGFYDSNVWGPIIDNLYLPEPNMLLARKELELLRKEENRKIDGIIRFGIGAEVFDVGVLEVAQEFVMQVCYAYKLK
ncbi:hypothetical protein BGX38DRAFT_403500 [Terfezia claveryi]|nr:hypothetical protein BGX38DRAFT_403500 [Terfezia claveryi]